MNTGFSNAPGLAHVACRDRVEVLHEARDYEVPELRLKYLVMHFCHVDLLLRSKDNGGDDLSRP